MPDKEAPGSQSGSSRRTDSGGRPEDLSHDKAWTPPGVDDAFSGNALGNFGEPLPEPRDSTPLDEDEPEGIIPPCPLWAMKDRRHVQWSEIVGFPPERIREAIGRGDATLYVIDDGHHHVMIGREVGEVSGGSKYGLVGRAPKGVFDALRSDQLPARNAFDEAEEVALCGVDIDADEKASDVFVVKSYGGVSSVPSEYLPGHHFIELKDPLPIENL
jgi:hypothetical protein